MSKKYITLREGFDYLYIGNEKNNLTEREFQSLSKYIEKNLSSQLVVFGYKCLRFINYVGVIALDNLVIEILPKISLSGEASEDRRALIFMLSKCRKLNIRAEEFIGSNAMNNTLIDIIGEIFYRELSREVQKGIYNEYVSVENSIGNIKGKLLVTKHSKINRFNKNKAYCAYDEFTEDNFFNRILKRTLDYLLREVKNERLKSNLRILERSFEEVSDEFIDKHYLNRYKLNRRNERFKNSFELAKMILNGSMGDNSKGNDFGFTLLFEMNYLYEEYIGVVLKEIMCEEEDIIVSTQEKSKYLLYNKKRNKEEISLKPDIVIYKKGIPKIIIDTKWKRGTRNGKENYSQADVYQMYAYVTSYKECEKCMLLYPKEEDGGEVLWNVIGDDNKEILMRSVDLSSLERTKNSLERII
ncbi:McrC family protein [Clostridium perfringens]|nr:McrC family protein [Clostridium perfringens]